MKKGLILALSPLIGLLPPTFAQQNHKSAEVTSAGDAYVPYQIVVDGLFVLDVSLRQRSQCDPESDFPTANADEIAQRSVQSQTCQRHCGQRKKSQKSRS